MNFTFEQLGKDRNILWVLVDSHNKKAGLRSYPARVFAVLGVGFEELGV